MVSRNNVPLTNIGPADFESEAGQFLQVPHLSPNKGKYYLGTCPYATMSFRLRTLGIVYFKC